MKAQVLYDVRALTGYISGVDLHEMFERLTGDPSPSGRLEIDEEKLSEDEVGISLLLKATQPLEWAIDEIKDYHDIP